MKIDLSDYTSGAGLASDLVNTGPDTRRELGDSLGDPDALIAFVDARGIAVPGGLDGVGAEDLARVHALRRRVRGILRSDSGDDVAREGNALLAEAARGPYLGRDPDDGGDGSDGKWEWYVAVRPTAGIADGLAALIGVGLLGALRTLGFERFRACAAPDCAGTFVDTSRAGRRRYCTPEVCGNRLNVANHRARRRAADHLP